MRTYKDKFLIEFERRCAEDPGLTSFIHFGRCVLGKKWEGEMIRHQLLKCINIKDYPDFTLDEMITHFIQLSQMNT